MAGNNSASKGNGAAKRMMNPKLKEKRQRSWARGEARKKRNREANEARAAANLAALKSLGGVQRYYDRVTVDASGKTVTRSKLESPGTALARTKREQR